MLRMTVCAAALVACCVTARASEPPHSAELDVMILQQAKRHGVPEKLVRRIVMRESRYNPRARNHSFWGLMQISYPTARSMGFKGTPNELLDPLVNLTYAVPYLANAFIIAGKQEDAAVRLYASGYYETAKNRNLLGQLRTADSTPLVREEGFVVAATRPVTNLVSAVVNGPAQTEAPPMFTSNPAALGPEPEVMMTAGKKGMEPPRKWTKDGGMSVVAKGEQRVDQVAAYVPPPGSEVVAKGPRRSVALRGHGKKSTEFAALDAAPTGVQAYAPPAGDQGFDAARLQGGPQAAIAQATAGALSTAADPSGVAQPGVARSGSGPREASNDTPLSDEPKLVRKPRPHRAAKKAADPDRDDATSSGSNTRMAEAGDTDSGSPRSGRRHPRHPARADGATNVAAATRGDDAPAPAR